MNGRVEGEWVPRRMAGESGSTLGELAKIMTQMEGVEGC